MAKTYAGTYLYSKYDVYERKIFEFIMKGTEIDKDTDAFDDIKYEIKRRQISNSLVNILASKDVILISSPEPLPKAFKVICAKDLKGKNKNKKKIFIDVSNIIKKDEDSGRYECSRSDIDTFISYLVSAMHTMVYYADENRIINNAKIVSSGAQAFTNLVTNTVDYLCKVSVMPTLKTKCMYMSTLYYVGNILGKDYNYESNRRLAKKISGISDREASVVDVQLDKHCMDNIKTFIENMSSVLHLTKLTPDVFIEQWMKMYDTGTVFALEMFTDFANMLTNCYVGAYLNNQKMIEKVTGQSMVEFVKTILSIDSESI